MIAAYSNKMSYYAVACGRAPGVYRTWAECESQVKGFSGAKYKKFPTMRDATQFAGTGPGPEPVVAESSPPPANRGPVTESGEVLIAFTDGACPANGPAAVGAWWGVCWPFHPEWSSAEKLVGPPYTNIRAEMSGIIGAITLANRYSSDRKKLIVYTDSKFTCDMVTAWMPSWKKAGWRKRGGPIANLDLVKRIDSLLETRPVELIWVPAHTGASDFYSVWNAEADRLATAAVGSAGRVEEN